MSNNLYFVSFGDPTKPKGQQAMGVCLIEALTSDDAEDKARAVSGVQACWYAHIYGVPFDGEEARELHKNALILPDELRALGYTI